MKLAQRLKSAKPSPTLALNAKAKALVAQGQDVVGFVAGEPDFDTPDFIKDAAIEALRSGFTKYTATNGILELRQAVCEKLQRENRLSYTPDQVLVCTGAKQALYNLFQALLDEGDEVLIVAPYWVSYPEMVQLAGGRPVVLHTREEDGFSPDPDAIRRALTPRTRAIILNSPNNPTGAVLGRKALEGIAAAIRDHDCLVVSDDIYEKLLYTGEFQNLGNVAPDLVPRLVLVNGMSKAFSMTGWRLGYAAGPRELIAGMGLVQDQSTSNASSIAQKAALAALQGPASSTQKMVAEYHARRDLFVAGLNALPGVHCRVPEGAFYVFPNITGLLGKQHRGKTLRTSLEVSEALLEHHKVAVMPGSAFGAEGFLRFSFVTARPNIEKGLARLRDFVSELR